MIYLESVKLIQFYLFEKRSIDISEITGIFGNNGTGKSTILDAIQIAMVGGNARHVALNAQADEKKSNTRSFRSYCLGQYGDSSAERVRDSATTYISLVWKDSITKEPITTGVCMYADGNTDTHEVRGRYILRGVELSLNDHIDSVDGEERPREWSVFKHDLIQKAKTSGEDEPLPKDSEQYIKAMLFALRGSGSSVPAYDAFIRSFRFALRMKFDKSVDQIVRDEVLEAKPTNIQKFKEVTESFRKLSDIVHYVEEKIADGEKVEAEYLKAAEESKRAATWSALSFEVAAEQALSSLNLAIDNRHDAEQHLTELSGQHKEKSTSYQFAKDEEFRFNQLRQSHTAHQEHGALQNLITQETATIEKKSRDLADNIKLINRTISHSNISYLSAAYDIPHGLINTLEESIQNKFEGLDRDALSSQLKPVFKHSSALVSELNKIQSDNQNSIKEVKEHIADHESSLIRIRDGRPPLSRELLRLQTEFHDSGLHPIPVCDLVQITDASWQPVIEAFLGRNLDALLVPAQEESKAFKIYRELNGQRAIYGAKIVRESAQKVDSPPLVGTVAELIVGSNAAAVAYIRSRFGDTRRAFTNEEAMGGHRTLTQDGMFTKSGEFERFKPVSASQFKIGAGDGSQKDSILNELTQFKIKLMSLEKKQAELERIIQGILQISGGQEFLLNTLDQLNSARDTVASLSKKLSLSADDEYIRLGEQEAYWKKQVSELSAQLEELIFKKGSAQTKCDNCIEKEKLANTAWQEANENKNHAKEDIDFDADMATKHWDSMVEKYSNSLADMHKHCTKHAETSVKLRNNAIQNGSKALGVFQTTHKEQLLLDSSDLDWHKELEWITEILNRLRGTELVQYKDQMNNAYLASQETFRTDVAIALVNNLQWLEQTMNRLNSVLSTCPVFTNGERYSFVRNVRPDLKALKEFVENVSTFGPNDDLLGGPGEIPIEFKKMLEDKVGSSGSMQSPLDDYREFFDFDIEILREDYITKSRKLVGHLSKRLGTGSGGEHRSPLYVIAGAALASAYRLDRGNNDGIRLIMLDEAFMKMDETNIVSTMQYFKDLGLQVLMASPGENQPILSTFLHSYYDMVKDAENNSVTLEHHAISEDARELLRQDLPQFNEALLNEELARMGHPPINPRVGA